MPIIDRILHFFTKLKSNSAESNENAGLEEEQKFEVSPYFLPQATQNAFEDTPLWLSDLELLRDEGVIFGLSATNADDKIQILRSYFAKQTTPFEKEIQLYSEKIGEINLTSSHIEQKIETLKNRQTAIKESSTKEHQFLRSSVMILFSLVAMVGNYFLLDFVVRQVFPENHLLIAAGIFSVGMFSVFSPFSYLLTGFAEHKVFRILEEIGIPLFTAFFVFTLAIGQLPTLQVWGISLFSFVLFLFSGKIALHQLIALRDDLNILSHNAKVKNDKNKLAVKLEEELKVLENEILECRKEKWKIIPDLNKAEEELSKLIAKRDTYVHLFVSEFNLAKSYRSSLSQTDLKKIIE